MSISGSDVAAHFRQQASTLSSLISEHQQVLGYLKQRDQDLVTELNAARRELAAVYLPFLTDEDLQRVARLTGFQGFARRDPRAAREHERHVIQTSIARIEADERYQRRDVLVGADGTLTQERDSANEMLAPLQAECEKFELLVDFATLIEIGYDTPKFDGKWWQASYWKHWAAGDRICKTLGMGDFGDDVIPAYAKSAEPRNFMKSEVDRLDKAIGEVHALVQEHDGLVHRLAHLDEIYLSESQDFLGEHLVSADAALLEQWAQGEPELLRAVQMGVRKIAGIQAKRSILTDMAGTGVPQLVGQLEQRRAKAQAKATKFSRPKYTYATFADTTVNDGFDERSRAMQGQIGKLQRRVDALVANRNYAGFDLRNDQHLWWWYFMETPPPRYAPHYYDYYQRNTGFNVITDSEFVDAGEAPGEAAARAYAAGDLEQGGYLS